MRIVSLYLHRFGAVVDEHLDFSDGLNVVSGPNEAGKSTWHAAATLLLTGFPKTMRAKAVKPLFERYRPWTGTEYKISGVVELDDGRRLRIVRDFAKRTSEIHEEGKGPLRSALTTDASCDLAELVGLDRATLPLVASVRQTEILELARSATSAEGAALRDFLQRSLASRCGDVTAESAIEAIDRYRRTHIGSTKQGSNKPMRRAIEAARAADAAYQHGVAQWEQYRERERELSADLERRSALGAELADARVETLRCERTRLTQLVEEIAAIDARLCGSVHADEVPTDERLDQARQLWARQSVFEERSRDLDSLQNKRDQLLAEIAELPAETGTGIETVPASVTAARSELEDARRFAALVEHEAPDNVDAVVSIDADPGFIRSVAAELETAVSGPDPEMRNRRDELKTRTGDDQRRATQLIWLGMIVLIGAIVCVGIGSPATMAVGFVMLGMSAISMWRSVHKRQRLEVQLSKLAEIDDRIARDAKRLEDTRVRRSEIEALAASWGCRPTPAALRQVAARVDDQLAQRDLVQRWAERSSVAERRVHIATEQLARALSAAGHPPRRDDGTVQSDDTDAVIATAQSFEEGVSAFRRRQADVARRHDLLDRCALLDEAIEAGERTERRIDAYVRAVESFLTSLGMAEPGRTIDDRLAALERWLCAGRDLRSRWKADEQLRARRDILCAHGEPDQLRERIIELEQRLSQSCTDGDEAPGEFVAVASSSSQSDGIARLQADYRRVQERIDHAQGALSELAGQLTELTELAEERAKARTELDRLVRQEAMLSQAQDHLNAARSRVHSVIAPQLVRATSDRLALVTAGRYKRLDINPDDLSVHVEVAGGTWHDSSRLSFGTVEQIYLLLRTAIAEVVAPDTETCPLLLDDTTVHADGQRTQALIEVLGDLSRDRQVIVFSQETVVRSAGSGAAAMIIDLAA